MLIGYIEACRVDVRLDDSPHTPLQGAWVWLDGTGAAESARLSPGVTLVLSSLVLFEVKHFLCDFVLQTAYLYRNKGIYGHRAGFIHAGLHAGGSLPAILLLSHDSTLILGIMIAALLIHYPVDWLELHIDTRYRLGINQSLYWAIFGADQLLHQLTYIGILALLANAARL